MRGKSIEGGNDKSQSKPPLRLLYGGHDPREMGRKGGRARAANLSPDELSAIGRNAQLARTLKQKNQLNNLVGPAIRALKLALKSKDESALVKAATAVLDRTGHGTKSSIEIDGEIAHSGEVIHRTQLLDVDRLPLIIKRMMVASLQKEWEPSPELEAMIRAELPMIEIPTEKKVNGKAVKAITSGSGQVEAQSVSGQYQQSISGQPSIRATGAAGTWDVAGKSIYPGARAGEDYQDQDQGDDQD